MFRNKKLRHSTVWMISLGIVLIVIASFQSLWFVASTALVVIAMVFVHLYYSYNRYKEMEDLSIYLRKISSGSFSLDVRDNDEGEISILKNEIYKMTQLLSEQKSQADDSKVKLAEALADISHQLKTPLTSMTVMTDLLAQDQLPKEKRDEFLGHISSQLSRMEWLVTSLLKLSKIDAGTITFAKEESSVERLIHETVSPLTIPMKDKQIHFETVGDLHAFIAADFRWTKEALSNILKNAVEHTDSGGKVTMTVTENVLFTELTVHNTGEPITPKDLPHIFKRFYQGNHAHKQSVGIGLALTYHIVTKQNGAIHVESTKRDGTSFSVRFYKGT